jgi:two-component system sensor histidine kinase PilS (NtrC family)
MATQPSPAIPPFEPPPLPLSVTDSARRILWIVALYRAVCGAVLLGMALLFDLRILSVAAPNAFLTAAAIYFIFGLAAFWWVQHERLALPLSTTLFALLCGDIFFLGLVMVAGGSTGAPLPILLFPQLAASGWLLRTQTGFFHAAFATVALLGLQGYRAIGGNVGAAELFQTGLIGFGYFATVGTAVALGRYTKASEDLAAQRGIDVANLEQVNRLIIQDMQDGVLVVDLNAASAACAAACAWPSSPPRCTTTGAAGTRTSRSRCGRSRWRRRSASCACAWCASARASTAAP